MHLIPDLQLLLRRDGESCQKPSRFMCERKLENSGAKGKRVGKAFVRNCVGRFRGIGNLFFLASFISRPASMHLY